MTLYLTDPDVTLYHGDCLDVLRQLPSSSVHMCATSPPFYGLRDYGTGEWEGGDPDCDHVPDTRQGSAKQDAERRERGERRGYAPGSNFANYGSGQTAGDAVYRQSCGKCGARRVDQQIGLEETPDQWVERLVAVFREVRRVLRDDGTLWVEIGDSYSGSGPSGASYQSATTKAREGKSRDGTFAISKTLAARGLTYAEKKPVPAAGTKAKDLIGQPWLLAFALRADGWYLRSEIIWARPNPMPESVTDRPTKSHSTVFLLSKRPRYFYDADAIREDAKPWAEGMEMRRTARNGAIDNNTTAAQIGKVYDELKGANARSVWNIATEPTPFAHFATWPRKLVARMIQAGTSERGCCPECGSPWVRDVEREVVPLQTTNNSQPETPRGWDADRTHPRAQVAVTTLGWSPSCACKPPGSDGLDKPGEWEFTYPPIPCTVLDPFAGSGTTNLVARNHGRHSIGIELNADYLKIAADRLSQLSLVNDEMFA